MRLHEFAERVLYSESLADEITDISNIKVSTILNGKDIATNSVSNMTFSPSYLISFISKILTLYPGDIILTGTPEGVASLNSGDKISLEFQQQQIAHATVKYD